MDSDFEPVVLSRTSLAQQVAERLRGRILDGRLQPGQKLPPERQLASLLNVGRTSLREAVKLLESAGLLVVRRGKGVFVAADDPGERFHELLSQFSAPAVEPRRIADLYQVRRVLEVEAAAWAARGIRRDGVARLRRLCEAATVPARSSPPDFARLMDLDGEFHGTIFRATGNEVLVRMTDSLLDLLAESRSISIRRPGRAARSWLEHRRITDALAARDAAAARREMLRHIVGVERSTFVRRTRHSDEAPS